MSDPVPATNEFVRQLKNHLDHATGFLSDVPRDNAYMLIARIERQKECIRTLSEFLRGCPIRDHDEWVKPVARYLHDHPDVPGTTSETMADDDELDKAISAHPICSPRAPRG